MEIINNKTYGDEIPISSTYASLYNLFMTKSFIKPVQINTTEFFDQLSMQINMVSNDFSGKKDIDVIPHVFFSI